MASRAPELRDAVASCARRLAEGPTPSLCAVFATVDFPDVHEAGRLVRQLVPGRPTVVGCAVDNIHGANGPAVAVVALDGDAPLASFHDPIAGITPKRVGRYFTPEPTVVPDLARLKSSATMVTQVSTPASLLPHAAHAGAVLVFGDLRTEHMLVALDDSFASSIKLGLVGASTPFINGASHTLFLDDDVYADAVVGAVLPRAAAMRLAGALPQPLRAMGTKERIVRAKGNILLQTSGDELPSQALLDLLKKRERPMSKDEEFFLSYALSANAESSAVFRVASGDPSRGQIAIDGIRDLQTDAYVQFLSSEAKADALPGLCMGVLAQTSNGAIGTSSDLVSYIAKHPGGTVGGWQDPRAFD